MDFTFANHGSICILTPLTQPAKSWIEEHIPEDASWWHDGLVIEPRYAEAILQGLAEDGLEVAS